MSSSRRALGLLAAVLLLLVVMGASIAIGAKVIGPSDVWNGLFDPDDVVVRQMRLPRTILALLAGLALGLAGAVMQAVTRNPLADPGLLGINSGASAAVVSAIAFAGVTNFNAVVWLAFLGAAIATVGVYLIGGARGATPARLALSGTALNAVLLAYISAVMLLDTASLDRMRFWSVGSLAAPDGSTTGKLLPFVVIGAVLAIALARPLNAIALGEESAVALGANPARTRALAILSITILCGAATAACGPIVFVGLMMPHLVRAITGPDLRWLLPYCAVLAPVLLIGSDVIGRVIARPSEVEVGIVTAVLGGPFFLYFVRRRKSATT